MLVQTAPHIPSGDKTAEAPGPHVGGHEVGHCIGDSEAKSLGCIALGGSEVRLCDGLYGAALG